MSAREDASTKRTLHELDLNLLVALDVLLRERNVTRAGAALGMSQPTMSGALGRLRRFFDDELLVRVGREFQLTAAAADLQRPVQDILAQVQGLIDRAVPFDPATDTRAFRVVCTDYSQLMLRGLVPRLRQRAPGIDISFQLPTDRTDRLLRERRADLVVLGALPGFVGQELLTDDLVCVFDRDHPEIGESLTPDQFVELPHVGYLVGRRGRQGAEEKLAALGVKRRIAVTTDSYTASLFLLRGTRMIAIAQARLADLLADATGTRHVPLPFPVGSISISQFWHPFDDDDAAHRFLRSLVAATAQEVAAAGPRHQPG